MFGGWQANGQVFYVWHNGRDPASFDLYTVSITDYSQSLVFKNPGFLAGIISNSGRWLALDKPKTITDSDIYLVDLSTNAKTPVLITEHEGNIAFASYAFTPDDSALIYSTNEIGEFNQAWRYDLSSGAKSPLIEAQWDVSYVLYSPSGQ